MSTVDNASLCRLKPLIKIKLIFPRFQIANGEDYAEYFQMDRRRRQLSDCSTFFLEKFMIGLNGVGC